MADNFHENPEAGYEYVKETTSRYISSKVKTVKQTASKAWEGTKDVIESGLTLIIRGEQKATELIQNAGAWWNGLDTVQAVRKKAEQINTTWKNSPIGSKVTALQEQTNSAARHLYESWANGSMGEWYNETKNSITTFYEENKTAVNSIGGVAIIAGCAAAAYIGGEAACTALAVAATEAAKGALLGGAIGAPVGGFSNLLDYMKEHGTIDGSTKQVLEGMAEGFRAGAEAGALTGFLRGMGKYLSNPDAYCFVAGTLVATAVGMTGIEDIRPGDYVYAKN